MSHFSPLGSILSLLRASFERFPVRNIADRLHLVLRFVRKLLRQPSRTFNARISHILNLLETHDETSDPITSAVKELNSFFPLPHVQLIPQGVWPKEPTCRIRVQTHLKSTFADAVNLLKTAGRALSPADGKYLRLLLTHYCGWSATYPEHTDDPWVKFFQTRYPQLKGLVPILDSMTYLEELVDFPDGYNFRMPQFFLLATSDSYFVYDATDGEDGLRTAGQTLEDVYNGLKDWRWADSSEEPWGFVEEEEWLDPGRYFPYYYRKGNGNFGVGGWGPESYKEYPGKVSSPGLIQSYVASISDNLNINR